MARVNRGCHMLLHVTGKVCEPSGKVNEDIAGSTKTAAWVMDGATGLGDEKLLPGESDAAWLVQRVDAFLRAYADDASLGMAELFAAAIEDVQFFFFYSKGPPGHLLFFPPPPFSV